MKVARGQEREKWGLVVQQIQSVGLLCNNVNMLPLWGPHAVKGEDGGCCSSVTEAPT